ncbi:MULTISPECIES: conjugal transfer protein TraF [unclassified Helicobacter]|uniref:conjugal transfer protein TraF n=1 Tax=unclassified Helicobacter TaxID=2593540 RepID=UPI000CF084EF|nr:MULTISPECIES: conjugal transfer protein TraF [unclassified Helicobacter]
MKCLLRGCNHKHLILPVVGLLLGSLKVSALEFGGLGNVSAGMGGAGVALKNSQWAIYYNPALLGVNKKSRFGYSFGVSVKEENLIALTKVDFKNLQSLPDQISGLFSDAKNNKINIGPRNFILSSALDLKGLSELKMGGYFGDVIDNLVGNGDDFDKVLGDIMTSAGVSHNGEAIEDFQNALKGEDGDKLFNAFKEKLQEASKEAGGNAIFDSLIDNLTYENVSGIVDLVGSSGGDVSIDKVLDKLGGIKLSLSKDAKLNKAIKDIASIQNTLKHNNFSVVSQNGLTVQLAPHGSVGGFGMGLIFDAFVSGSAALDQKYNRIIVNSGDKYVELGINNDGITVDTADKNSYNSSSILSPNAKHHISATGLAVVEIPVGYGHSFDIGFGELSIGASIKYLQGIGYNISQTIAIDNVSKVKLPTVPTISQNFGIDLGALYSVGGFSLGFVAKNINNPGLKVNSDKTVYLNPQLRAGVSYEWSVLSLAFDVDILPNNTLSYTVPKNQMIGGGIMFDFKYFDIRAGAMYDLKGSHNDGVVLTAGLNIFGFFDIAVQSGLNLINLNDKIKIPNNLNIKIGGGFSW